MQPPASHVIPFPQPTSAGQLEQFSPESVLPFPQSPGTILEQTAPQLFGIMQVSVVAGFPSLHCWFVEQVAASLWLPPQQKPVVTACMPHKQVPVISAFVQYGATTPVISTVGAAAKEES